jgi:hypothetical protein
MAGLLEHLDELIEENKRTLAGFYIRGDKSSREQAAAREYEHNTVVIMIVNGVVVALAVAACPESFGTTCALAVAFVAGGATSEFSYQVSNKRHSAAGYATQFLIGGAESLAMQGLQAGALKWAEPLTLTRSEKILLEGPVGNMTRSALLWARAGYLYLGLKTGRW